MKNFGIFWTVYNNVGSFWLMLDSFWPVWLILETYGTFWENIGPISTILDHIGQFGIFCWTFCTNWTILDKCKFTPIWSFLQHLRQFCRFLKEFGTVCAKLNNFYHLDHFEPFWTDWWLFRTIWNHLRLFWTIINNFA